MLFSGSVWGFGGAKLHSPGLSGPNGKITVIFRGSFQWTATEVDEAAVVFGAHDEFGANIDRAKVVHEHRDAQAVVAGQDAVEQRGLTGAAEAGKDRGGHRSTLHNDRFRFERVHVHLTTAKAADSVRPLIGS